MKVKAENPKKIFQMLIKEQRENFAQKERERERERERVLIIIKVYFCILATNNQFGNSKVPLVNGS